MWVGNRDALAVTDRWTRCQRPSVSSTKVVQFVLFEVTATYRRGMSCRHFDKSSGPIQRRYRRGSSSWLSLART